MQCPSCKASLPDDLKYCLHCGHYLGELSETTWVSPPPVQQSKTNPVDRFVPKFESVERPEREYSFGIGKIVFVSGCLLLVGGLIAALMIHNTGGAQIDLQGNRQLTVLTPPRPSATEQAVQSPLVIASPAPSTETLTTPRPEAETSLRLRPSPSDEQSSTPQTIVFQSFAVPPQHYVSYPMMVPDRGARIYGRFQAVEGDNIKVHIVDGDGLENMRHHSQYRTWYESGKVTVGTIDVKPVRGGYFLVFENFYSVISNKVVRAEVRLLPLN